MSIVFRVRKHRCGGYGDRLVGLVSILFLSKMMNKKFYIDWQEDIYYVDVKNKMPFILQGYKEISLIDSRANEYIEKLRSKRLEEIFNYDNFIVLCNQNIIPYIYLNPHYKDLLKIENYSKDIKNMYDDIYTKYLIPNHELISFVNKFMKKDRKIIGIHMRTGDVKMGVGSYVGNSDEYIRTYISKISKSIVRDNHYYLISSDYKLVHDCFSKALGKDNILYYDSVIMHMSMPGDKDIKKGLFKMFIDHIALSRCNTIYYQTHTNFGRTAAIICDGERYCLNNMKRTDISIISSKIAIPDKILSYIDSKMSDTIYIFRCSHFFEIISLVIYESLTKLGFKCVLSREVNNNTDKIWILFNSFYSKYTLPDTYIVYQTEPNISEYPKDHTYLDFLKRSSQIWEYSQYNIDFLKSVHNDVLYIPFGYSPCLETWNGVHNMTKNIDVYFLGPLSGHRRNILNSIKHVNLKHDHEVFGIEREKKISSSKINLILQKQPNSIFTQDISRVFPLGAKKQFMISEKINDTLIDSVIQCDIKDLNDRIRYYLNNEDERKKNIENVYNEILDNAMSDTFQKNINDLLFCKM